MKKLNFCLLSGSFILGILAFLIADSGWTADLYIFRDGGPAYYTNIPGPGREKYRPGVTKWRPKRQATLPQGAGSGAIRNPEYAEVIASACERFDVDPDLVRAVIKAESNFDPQAVSPKGAMGLMQLMPATAREMGVSDPFNPAENIAGGVGYLSRLLNNLNGDFSLALAAYNAGPERVKNYQGVPPFRETMNYIQRVMNYYQLFKGNDQL